MKLFRESITCFACGCGRFGVGDIGAPSRQRPSFWAGSSVRSSFNLFGSGKADMRIRRNLVVLSHDRTLKDAGRGDQQLVGWIAMERLRQLG